MTRPSWLVGNGWAKRRFYRISPTGLVSGCFGPTSLVGDLTFYFARTVQVCLLKNSFNSINNYLGIGTYYSHTHTVSSDKSANSDCVKTSLGLHDHKWVMNLMKYLHIEQGSEIQSLVTGHTFRMHFKVRTGRFFSAYEIFIWQSGWLFHIYCILYSVSLGHCKEVYSRIATCQ